MTQDPVHSCLDGEALPDELSPQEQARLARMKALLDTVVTELRADTPPDLVPAVMQRLPTHGPATPAWRRIVGWMWTPRPVQFRPAYAMGAAGFALAAVVLGTELQPDRQAPQVAHVEPRPAAVYVQFRLEAEGAQQVALAGSFTGWRPEYTLHETAPGVWTAMVPLRPGVHDYSFVIDGTEWVPDPYAPQVDDQFGGRNSRLSLVPPNPEL